MTKKDRLSAVAPIPGAEALLHQKSQLVNAFMEVSAAMRKAALEAEMMANAVASSSLSGGSRLALESATRMMQAFQAPRSPETDDTMPGVTATNPKKRGRPSATADPASPDTGNENGIEKPKRIRAKRDPNQPKRPATAYILFQNDVRETFRATHPELNSKELSQELSKAWQALPLEKRQPYLDQAGKNKEAYNEQMKVYDAPKASATTTITTATPARVTSAAAAPTSAKASASKTVTSALKSVPVQQRSAPTQPGPPAGDSDAESGSSSEDAEESEESEDSESEEEEEEVVQSPPTKKLKPSTAPHVVAATPKESKKVSKK